MYLTPFSLGFFSLMGITGHIGVLDRLSGEKRRVTTILPEGELWIYLLAHNLIRLLMAQSALLGDCLPQQLSFKHALQIWGAWRQYHDGSNDEQMTSLL